MEKELVEKIEEEDLTLQDKERLTRVLRDQHDWDPSDIKKIWALGLDDYSANILRDKTVGMQHLKDVKPNLITSVQEVLRVGPLTGEKMRGVEFRITDAKLHADNMHRGAGQVGPMMGKGCKAAFLEAQPRLMEPIFLCTVKTEEERRGDVYTCFGNRRGRVIADDYDYGNMITIKAHLPVAESFGFTTYLRDETQGRAQPMTAFSHWEILDSDPLEEGSEANEIVKQIRLRKGMDPSIPTADRFRDRL